MTIRTKSTIDANIVANLADNSTMLISAQDSRDAMRDINESAPFQDITSSGNNAGAITIDLSKPVQTITLTDNVTSVATSNRSSSISKLCKVFISPGAADKGIVFGNSWKWVGVKPSGMFANISGLLLLVNFGSTENEVVAAYEHLGIGTTGVYI